MAKRATLLLAILATVLGCTAPGRAQPDDAVLVFAAASLKTALDAAVDDYTGRSGGEILVSYGASSALAKQIEEGAPADIFLSADLDWMDYVAGRNLLDLRSRVTLLGNHLVLVAPAASRVALAVRPGFALAEALGDGRLAIAETSSVPAGKYGRAALELLGVWDSVADRLAPAENVRAALALVARGEAPLGLVYSTDARADADVVVVDTFPPDSHPSILYPASLTATAKPEARRFFAFLVSTGAKPFFEAEGFSFIAADS